MSKPELFELALHGGAAEERYRKLRPEIEAIDWDALRPDAPAEALVVARRQWTAGALQEYATAAIHAVTLNLMLQARVPLDLSGMFARFALDEIAHAELCARVAGALGGGAPVSYAREQVFNLAPGADVDPLQSATARLVRDCCISESLAAPLLRAAARSPGHPVLKKVHAAIARDEAVHGRFGWLFLEWAAPQLSAAQREVVARDAQTEIARQREAWAQLRASGELNAWSVCGNLGLARYLALGEETLAQRIVPGLQKLGVA